MRVHIGITDRLTTAILLLMIILLTGCATGARGPAVMPVGGPQGAAPAAAIYAMDQVPRREPGPNVILAVWPDGQLVWSADLVQGGPPYYAADVDPQRVRETIDRLDEQGLLGRVRGGNERLRREAPYTVIAIEADARQHDDDRELELRSWHELAENEPGVVATTAGPRHVNGVTRDELIAADVAEFRAFRERWQQVRRALLDLIPRQGREVERLQFELRPVR